MGLLRDAIGSAMGAGQVNNGLGPALPFMGGKQKQDTTNYPVQRYNRSPRPQNNYLAPNTPRFDDPPPYQVDDYSSQDSYQSYAPPRGPSPRPSSYGSRPLYNNRQSFDNRQPYQQSYDNRQSYQQSYDNRQSYQPPQQSYDEQSFHPIVLPQISYGEGQPFLRAYSSELAYYGISEQEFIQIIDSINVAIIPNPENQIFQKAANIAGWFIPGAAGIGVMAGQIGVGIGAAMGHATMVKRVLSKANLKIFIPQGLEICIGKQQNIDQEVGRSSVNYTGYGNNNNLPNFTCAEERVACYGPLVAPLRRSLPPLQQSGRTDPIAAMGRGMARRSQQKALEDAQKEVMKGKNKKMGSLEKDLEWLIIRQASPGAHAAWQKTLQETDVEIQQQQQEQQGHQYDSKRR